LPRHSGTSEFQCGWLSSSALSRFRPCLAMSTKLKSESIPTVSHKQRLPARPIPDSPLRFHLTFKIGLPIVTVPTRRDNSEVGSWVKSTSQCIVGTSSTVITNPPSDLVLTIPFRASITLQPEASMHAKANIRVDLKGQTEPILRISLITSRHARPNSFIIVSTVCAWSHQFLLDRDHAKHLHLQSNTTTLSLHACTAFGARRANIIRLFNERFFNPSQWSNFSWSDSHGPRTRWNHR
jgi:hypothetical protein